MLKYDDTIKKLSDAQKIRILSGVGSISGKDMKNLGIPTLCPGNMKEYGRNVYPHVTSLAHAWNTSLWRDVAAAKVQCMAEAGVNFAVAPGAKIKLSPYRKETTEDPYLASLISGAYMKAATDANMAVAASGYYVTESDTAWMDASPNERILNEYMVQPYVRAAKMAQASGLVTDIRTPNDAYANTCEHLQSVVVGQTEFFVCENANDDNTVQLVAKNVICLNGSPNALNEALLRYRKLKKLWEEGKDVSLLDIEQETKNGKAISDETIDGAVDHVLEFLFRTQEDKVLKSIPSKQAEQLAFKATLESTVLLKNQNEILPLAPRSKLAIINAFSFGEAGDLAEACGELLTATGYHCTTENVRETDEADWPTRMKQISHACKAADVTLLLLGSGYEAEKQMHKTEKLTLPPFQLSLVDRVKACANRVVAVIFSEHSTDVEFTRLFEGALFAPLPVKHSARALTSILSGAYNPTGRLAYTLYMGTQTAFGKGEAYLNRFGMKAGPFIGYRYYDTADLHVGYPFGYGKSYTDFVYTNLSISDNVVSFTVTNCGTVAGSEVAQVYVGKQKTAVLRPKKELCGFVKLSLKPMEKKRVQIRIEPPKVFDGKELVVEKGKYTVYVGASVSDIRLKRNFIAGDAELDKDGERLSDYLQSYSNILNDNFTLEANYSVMKKGFTSIIAGVIALVLAIFLAVFNMTTYASSPALGVISGILACGAIVLFVVEIIERSCMHARNRRKIAEANKAHFAEAKQIPVLSTQKMFEEQFDTVEASSVHIDHIVEGKNTDSNIDYSKYIDERFTFNDAVIEFNRFAAERGFKFERGVAENLLASFATSKLMILNGLSEAEFNAFVLLFSQYLECAVCLDKISAPALQTDASENVFFNRDVEGYSTKKNIFKALKNAVELPAKVHLAAIDGISSDNASQWLTPMMRYVKFTKPQNQIIIVDEAGKKWGFRIRRNLWFALRLADGQTVDMLPIEIVKCASVVHVSFAKCQAHDDPVVSKGLNIYQVEYMTKKISGKYEVAEDTWKKIDRLEKYAQGITAYSIGNKLWLDLEKQVEVLLASGLECSEAIDAATASRIIPPITVVVKDKISDEDQTVFQISEFIFGADNVQYVKKYIDSLVVKATEPPVEEAATVEEAEAPVEEAAMIEEAETPAEEVATVEEVEPSTKEVAEEAEVSATEEA